jgi:hypothetical protein
MSTTANVYWRALRVPVFKDLHGHPVLRRDGGSFLTPSSLRVLPYQREKQKLRDLHASHTLAANPLNPF